MSAQKRNLTSEPGPEPGPPIIEGCCSPAIEPQTSPLSDHIPEFAIYPFPYSDSETSTDYDESASDSVTDSYHESPSAIASPLLYVVFPMFALPFT